MRLYFESEGSVYAFNDIESAILALRGVESSAPDRDRDGAVEDRKALDLMRDPVVQRVMLELGGMLKSVKFEGVTNGA